MRPLMLLTMSSSGGKWLAGGIAAHLPGCRYYNKEFFNPICNLKHADRLTRNFGSELASCYRNIALPGDRHIHDDIKATWGSEDYTFTKEVFSPFKMRKLAEHFKLFVMVRRTEDCFPPARLRVWSFYEHAWQALRDAGHDVVATTVEDKAREAHAVMRAQLLRDATMMGIPVLRFEELMSADSTTLAEQIERAIGIGSEDMVRELIATRYRE